MRREREDTPHLSPTLSAAHSYPSSAGRSLRSLGSRTSRCLEGGEGELGGAACVPPPPFGGRGTGGAGPVVCATLSRARDPICCAHDPFAAPATFQARATRACRTRNSRARPYGRARLCPAESHLSHLIPANPALRMLLVSRARHAPSPAYVRSGRASARRLRDVNRCRAFVARVPARRYSRPADAALAGRVTARTTERSVPVGERSRRRGGAGALAPVGNPPHALKNEEEARSPRGSWRTTCGIE